VSWRRGSDPSVGQWWGAGCADALEDLDDNHATTTAGACRAMIGGGVSISAVSCAAGGFTDGTGVAISLCPDFRPTKAGCSTSEG
jgi:hypothetical protein